MKTNQINPWKWQDNLGYAQAVEVKQNEGTLYCAGQAAMSADGQPIEGTMQEQITLTLANVQQVIDQAGYESKNIVRLNIFTTSIGETFASWGSIAGWLAQYGCTPASTLVEVQALAFPQLKIEIEATVVK